MRFKDGAAALNKSKNLATCWADSKLAWKIAADQ